MDSDRDYLQRAIHAEQIASVIAHRRGHSFEKHKDEFGGDIRTFRQAIIDTLLNPETAVVKVSASQYRFYNKTDNVFVLIDQTAKDWGTAFRPDGNRGMMFMRERGLPIHENGNVTYLNKLHAGFFTQQDRLQQQPEPIRLTSLNREQSAEVLLSIFDRLDGQPARSPRLSDKFNAASIHVMPDMIPKIQNLGPPEKAALREHAQNYKAASSESFAVLKDSGLMGIKDKGGKPLDIAAVLRDPGARDGFILDLEEQYAMSEKPEDEAKIEGMLAACERFSVLDAKRQDALEGTCGLIDRMRGQKQGETPDLYQRPPRPTVTAGLSN